MRVLESSAAGLLPGTLKCTGLSERECSTEDVRPQAQLCCRRLSSSVKGCFHLCLVEYYRDDNLQSHLLWLRCWLASIANRERIFQCAALPGGGPYAFQPAPQAR